MLPQKASRLDAFLKLKQYDEAMEWFDKRWQAEIQKHPEVSSKLQQLNEKIKELDEQIRKLEEKAARIEEITEAMEKIIGEALAGLNDDDHEFYQDTSEFVLALRQDILEHVERLKSKL